MMHAMYLTVFFCTDITKSCRRQYKNKKNDGLQADAHLPGRAPACRCRAAAPDPEIFNPKMFVVNTRQIKYTFG